MRDAVISKTASVRHDGKLHELFIPNLVVTRCTQCGEIYLDNRANAQIQDALRTRLGVMRPEEMVALRELHGLSQADVSRDTGVAEETLSRWENGRMIQTRAMDILLRAYLSDPGLFRNLADVVQWTRVLPDPQVLTSQPLPSITEDVMHSAAADQQECPKSAAPTLSHFFGVGVDTEAVCSPSAAERPYALAA